MRLKLLFALALLTLPSTVSAQQMLAGQSLRLVPNTTSPTNVTGSNTGIWNHSGVLELHPAGGTSAPLLQCTSCTAGLGQIPKVNSLALLAPSGMAVAGVGPLLQLTITNGDIIINGNPANGGGLTFPDGSKQTTAATTATPLNQISLDPVAMVSTVSGNCNPNSVNTQNWQAQTSTPVGAPNQVTTGNSFMVLIASTITGGQAWIDDVSLTANITLWSAANSGATSPVATCNVTVTAAGKYSCNFGSPVAAVPNSVWMITSHLPNQHTTVIGNCATGTGYNNFPGVGGSGAVSAGPNIIWISPVSGTGNAVEVKPTAGNGNSYPIRPLWTVP